MQKVNFPQVGQVFVNHSVIDRFNSADAVVPVGNIGVVSEADEASNWISIKVHKQYNFLRPWGNQVNYDNAQTGNAASWFYQEWRPAQGAQ